MATSLLVSGRGERALMKKKGDTTGRQKVRLGEREEEERVGEIQRGTSCARATCHRRPLLSITVLQ